MSITSNINDPNYFLAGNSVTGDFNTLSEDNSGIGIIPAAEQNTTYVAYIESVGNTSPEIINQTGYFVKYLIDDQGNVTTVSPNSIALYNLRNMFPEGSTAIMDSPTATSVLASLVGEHTVTDVGSIQPLLITENGSQRVDYEPTMSFVPYNSNQLIPAPGEEPTDFSFRIDTGPLDVISTYFPVPMQASALSPVVSSDPAGGWVDRVNNSSSYEYSSDLANVGTTVSFKARLGGQFLGDQQKQWYAWQIQTSNDEGATWKSIPWKEITYTNTGNPEFNNRCVITTSIPTATDAYEDGITPVPSIPISFSDESYDINQPANVLQFFSRLNTSGTANEIPSAYYFVDGITDDYTFAQGAWVRLVWACRLPGAFIGDNKISSVFYSFINETVLTKVTASYFDSIQNVDNQDKPQWVTASLELSNVLQVDQIQITPSASSAWNFANIVYPANIQPGDYIRFEYNPKFMSKIYEVNNLNDGRYAFKVYPPFPSGVETNHFCIFRMENNGKTVTLNTIKPPGGQVTGILRPKNISEEFKIKIPSIVDRLKTDGLIE